MKSRVRWTITAAFSLSLSLAACARGSHPADVETGDAFAANPPTAGRVGATSDSRDGDAAVDVTRREAGEVDPVDAGQAPGTSVIGAVAGVSVRPAHAAAIAVSGALGVERIVVTVTTRPGFCDDYAAGIDRAGERTLIFAVIASDAISTVGRATYSVGAGRPSSAGGTFDTSARVLSYDAQCRTTVAPADEFASSGTLTLDSVGGVVSGTFDVTFAGGSFRGALDAPTCVAPGADTFTCHP
jgi:hypothetical protein